MDEDRKSWTPLHCSCAEGMLDVVLFLVHAGAAIESRTPDEGLTPLMVAVQNDHEDAVEELVGAADKSVKGGKCCSPRVS
ncbi:Sex-determining protein fem-1 [Diplonema papillatum]|nr:Sex-determining protein fem-1 [Diplonema papillatum]